MKIKKELLAASRAWSMSKNALFVMGIIDENYPMRLHNLRCIAEEEGLKSETVWNVYKKYLKPSGLVVLTGNKKYPYLTLDEVEIKRAAEEAERLFYTRELFDIEITKDIQGLPLTHSEKLIYAAIRAKGVWDTRKSVVAMLFSLSLPTVISAIKRLEELKLIKTEGERLVNLKVEVKCEQGIC